MFSKTATGYTHFSAIKSFDYQAVLIWLQQNDFHKICWIDKKLRHQNV